MTTKKQQIERSLLPDLRNGSLLFAISCPFSLTAIFKMIYYAALSQTLLTGAAKNIATSYDQYSFIRFMWPISPTPSFERFFTVGNLITLFVMLCTLVGFGWMSRAFHNYFRLQDAKRDANEEQLRDDFKNE